MHAHMMHPPTQHTHIIELNICHIYRHQTYYIHCKASRYISTTFRFQHTAKYYIKFSYVL